MVVSETSLARKNYFDASTGFLGAGISLVAGEVWKVSNGALLMVGLAFLVMELMVFFPFLSSNYDLNVLIYSFLSLIGSDSLTKFGVRYG